MNIGKTLLSTVVSAAVVSAIPATALAVPVVPNFTQGSMTRLPHRDNIESD